MDQRLSISQAARLVGESRRTLQDRIRAGEIKTDEGYITLEELKRVFPDAGLDRNRMVERVKLIQATATRKTGDDVFSTPERMTAEIKRLRLRLAEAHTEIDGYREFTDEAHMRLLELQERCDRHQSALLSTLLTWFTHQMKRHP